jgi:L-malate glycosyltransferase
MNILHLCSDYAGTPLYRDLVESLDKKGIQQTIYIPVRSEELINKYRSHDLLGAKYYYSYILNPYLRFNYYRKINKVYEDVRSKVKYSSLNLVHAHFLFSDGGVAYKLRKEIGLDYIVTVRNTDIHVFYKYMIHLRKYGLKILNNAQKIVFLSPTYKNTLFNQYIPSKYREKLEAKSVIIPNGVNDFWLQNLSEPKKIKGDDISLIYVGEFSKNKNITTTLEVIDRLREKRKEIHLTIIGQYGDNAYKIQKLVSKRTHYIHSLPRITEKKELLYNYRKADIFIMPSFYETFGLVYLEAMSQGLPVIYTKDQGFAGFYMDGEIGFAVHPGNVNEIVEKLEMIICRYEEISKKCINEVKNFRWELIASKYIELYTSVALSI